MHNDDNMAVTWAPGGDKSASSVVLAAGLVPGGLPCPRLRPRLAGYDSSLAPRPIGRGSLGGGRGAIAAGWWSWHPNSIIPNGDNSDRSVKPLHGRSLKEGAGKESELLGYAA
jgi:hypothetical protein